MTSKPPVNIAASIHGRLLARTQQTGADFHGELVRYGNERLLARIAASEHAATFVLSRMLDAELFHNAPAFAGVVKEFESFPEVDQFFRSNDAHTTQRARQAIGVLIRMTMEANGWKAAGRKGTLGRRAKVGTPTTRPGAYFNETGLARWFTQTERYVPREGTADHAMWVKLWA